MTHQRQTTTKKTMSSSRKSTAMRPANSTADEEDLKLRELMQAKDLAPPTPTPPNGSRKASLPDSVL